MNVSLKVLIIIYKGRGVPAGRRGVPAGRRGMMQGDAEYKQDDTVRTRYQQGQIIHWGAKYCSKCCVPLDQVYALEAYYVQFSEEQVLCILQGECKRI